MLIRVCTVAVAFLFLAWCDAGTAVAQGIHVHFGQPICGECRQATCRCHRGDCPAGCEVCELKIETIQEKKKGYKVECKSICIPPIQLPFFPFLTAGKVRTVKVLKSESYEVPATKYTWSVKDLCAPADKD